jgi:DNA polymerase elongation subunit (family B)
VVNTIERTALRQLAAEGRLLRAGQVLQYAITDYYNNNKRSSKRATPIEMIDDRTGAYDVRRYIELLAEAAPSVTEPFNFHEKIIAEAASSDCRIERLGHQMVHRL